MAESLDAHYLEDGTTKIPRPLNSFVLFRAQFKDTLPAATSLINVSQLAGDAWKNLSEEERTYWKGKADEASVEHRVKYPNYKYLPRKKVPKESQAGPVPAEKRKGRKGKGAERAVLVDFNREEEAHGPSVAHAPANDVIHSVLGYSNTHAEGAGWPLLGQNIHPSLYRADRQHTNQVALRVPVAQYTGAIHGLGEGAASAFQYPVAGSSTSRTPMNDLRRSALSRSNLNAHAMDGGEYRFTFTQNTHRDSPFHGSQDLNQAAFAQRAEAFSHGANGTSFNSFSTSAAPAYVPASSSRSPGVNNAVNSGNTHMHSTSAYGLTHAFNSNFSQSLDCNQSPHIPNNMAFWMPPQQPQAGTPWSSTQGWVPAHQPSQTLSGRVENPVGRGAYMDSSEPLQLVAPVLNACESMDTSTYLTTHTNEAAGEGTSVQPADAHREQIILSWEPNSEYPKIADKFLENWGLDDSLQPLEESR